jgi:anti-sigma factor RsiW
MVERNAFTDQQIQDYIDGRLNERDRAAVAAYLLAHPRIAADVEAVRRQSDALRALGHEILDEPVPEHLRRILRERRAPSPAGLRRVPSARRLARHSPGFLAIAAAILLFCAGGAVGWFAHGAIRPAPTHENLLLADINRAYALFGARDYPVLFPADRAGELVTWIGRSFAREVRPPDLDEFGYRYRGGRVIPSADANVGLFQFERPDNAELAVFFWTTAAPPRLDLDNLAARVWSTNGVSFAVVSDKANRDLETAAATIFAFYEKSFEPR